MAIQNTVSSHLSLTLNELGKMVEEMKSGDDVLRTKVLREINEDYHQADKLNLSLETEILFQLVHCCRE